MTIEDLSYNYQRLVAKLIQLMLIYADLSYDLCKIIHEYIGVIRIVLRLIKIMYDHRTIVVQLMKIQYDSGGFLV